MNTQGKSMKHRFLLGLGTLVLAAGGLWLGVGELAGRSYYYYENFQDQAHATAVNQLTWGGWTNFGISTNAAASPNQLYKISRDGVHKNPDAVPYGASRVTNPSHIEVTGAALRLWGRANNGNLDLNSIWVGRAAQFLPKNTAAFGTNFSASADEPIGFTIIRKYANIDSNDETQGGTGESGLTIWLGQDDSSKTNNWDNLPNFVIFYEKNKTAENSKFGWYDGNENTPSSVTGPTNQAFTGFTAHPWARNYNDTVIARNDFYTYGTQYLPNTNTLAIRVLHNGSKVRIFLNPAPYAPSGTSNQFYLLGESSAPWNSNMKVLIGHEALYFYSETQSAIYDDFLVRSVCKTITATNYPNKVLANTTQKFYLTVTPTFSAEDSGIGELVIRKPAFLSGAWKPNTVAVSNDYDDNGSLTALTRETTAVAPSARGRFRSFVTADGDLKILFKTDTTDNGVIGVNTDNKTILVSFDLDVPSTANTTGDVFQVFAGLEKYVDWTWPVLSLPTTGHKRAVPVTSGATIVRSYGPATAFAAVTTSPGVITEGNASQSVTEVTYELSTRDVVNAPAVSQAYIKLHNAFQVSNVQSLLIQNDAANIQVTNQGTNTFIVLKYSAENNGMLPSPNGYDRVTFTVYGTPDIPDGATNRRYQFSSQVSAAAFVSGAGFQPAGTNALYPSQWVTVAAEDPKPLCHVFPNTLGNATRTNVLTYTVYNNGNAYNKLYRVRITFDPAKFTNVSVLSHTKPGSISWDGAGTGYVYINYAAAGTNLPPGHTDTITLTTVHNIATPSTPESSGNLPCYGDNNNGKGYVLGLPDGVTWTVRFQPPDPKGQAYVTPSGINTSDVTNTFQVYIFNNGPKGDKVQQALVAVPANFTNFATAQVTTSLAGGQFSRINRGGVNYIWLKYFANATNIVSRNEQAGVNPYDLLTIKLADNLTATGSHWFTVYVDNKTNASFTNSLTTTNRAADFATNTQWVTVNYPPLNVSWDVESRFTNTYLATPENQYHRLDATTVTNLVVVRIKNKGDAGNLLRKVFVYLPLGVATNIVPVSGSSAWLTSHLKTGGIGFRPASATNDAHLEINYQGESVPLDGGQEDTISFRMIDTAVGNSVATFRVQAQNDRHRQQLTQFYGAGSQDNLEIFMPPARAAGSISPAVFYTTPGGKSETNTVVCTVSNTGGGSNNLTKVTIGFPAFINGTTNAVLAGVVVTNQKTSANVTGFTPVLTATDLSLTFGTSLPPGTCVRIHFKVRVTYNPATLAGHTWTLLADNSGTQNNATTTVPGGSMVQNQTVRPFFTVYGSALDDHTVLTSNEVNTVHLRLVNGTNLLSSPIHRIRITVPQPFNMPSTNVANTKAMVYGQTNRDVYIKYGTPVTGYNFDIVSLVLNDNFDENETNTSWAMHADFGTGVWLPVNASWRIDGTWYTNVLRVVLPPATAAAWLDPATLYVDAVASTYNVSVSNNGIPGNHIRMIQVTPPAFITNVNLASVSLAPAITHAKSWAGGKLTVTLNDRLLVGQKVTVSFTGYDDVSTSSGSPVPWSVKVANTTNAAGLNGAAVQPGKTLSTLATFPEFRSEWHVTPNTLDTSALSNVFTFYVDNKSPQTGSLDSYIQNARIVLPAAFLTNAGLVVTSQRGAAITLGAGPWGGGTNAWIQLAYGGAPLAPKDGDVVTVKVRDSWAQGSTNLFWNLLVNFDTLGTTYTNATLINGTNLAAFVMPRPSVRGSFAARDLYTTAGTSALSFRVTNAGTGSNDVRKVTLDVPVPFRAGFAGQASARGAVLSWTGTQLVAWYTNQAGGGMAPGTGDVLTFNVSGTPAVPAAYLFAALAENSTVSSNAWAVGSENVVNVVTGPTAQLSPNLIDTTSYTNTVSLFVNNNGSGSSAVRRVEVTLPAVYGGVLAVTSSKVGSSAITNSGATWFITYGAAAIANGDFDTLNFTVTDTLDHGAGAWGWGVRVDNGMGFASARPAAAGALTNAFSMPAPSARAWLRTTWIYASETAAQWVTNTLNAVVSNTGSGSNDIYKVRLILPTDLSNVSLIASQKPFASFSHTDGTNVVITYNAANRLKPGQADVISFRLRDNVNVETSYLYGFAVDNDADDNAGTDVFTAVTAPAGKQQRLDIFIKEEDPELFLFGVKAPYIWEAVTNNTFYTMDDAGVYTFTVKNKSKRFAIQGLRIAATNMASITVTAVTSTVANRGLAYSNFGGKLYVEYGSTNLPALAADSVQVYFTYDKAALAGIVTGSGRRQIDLTGAVRFATSDEYRATQQWGRNKAWADNATFGRFFGRVLPANIGPTVTLKYHGSETLATNTLGQLFNAAVNTNTGVYVVDKVPAGQQFTLLVIPPTLESRTVGGRLVNPVNYRSLAVDPLNATNNVVRAMTNLILRYDRLNSQAKGTQEVLCPTDLATKLVVPPGSLFQGFSVNITLEDMTVPQENGVRLDSVGIKPPVDVATLSAWHFQINGVDDSLLLENGFKADVELVLHYDAAAVTAQGWNASRLAIFYWKDSTRQWVLVGGAVDTATATVRAQVGYLHGYYAVMETGQTATGAIRNVKSSPNPFTPGRGEGSASNVKLTFTFDQPYETYEVKIHDLTGRLVWTSGTRSGAYAQGEVFWDGKNQDGFKVRGGVYLYQIKAGNKVFTGSILVLK